MRTPGTLGLGEKARHLERYISLWVFSLSLLKSESDSNIVCIAAFVLFFLMLDEGSWLNISNLLLASSCSAGIIRNRSH